MNSSDFKKMGVLNLPEESREEELVAKEKIEEPEDNEANNNVLLK